MFRSKSFPLPENSCNVFFFYVRPPALSAVLRRKPFSSFGPSARKHMAAPHGLFPRPEAVRPFSFKIVRLICPFYHLISPSRRTNYTAGPSYCQRIISARSFRKILLISCWFFDRIPDAGLVRQEEPGPIYGEVFCARAVFAGKSCPQTA